MSARDAEKYLPLCTDEIFGENVGMGVAMHGKEEAGGNPKNTFAKS
jgi:hypothetical protein